MHKAITSRASQQKIPPIGIGLCWISYIIIVTVQWDIDLQVHYVVGVSNLFHRICTSLGIDSIIIVLLCSFVEEKTWMTKTCMTLIAQTQKKMLEILFL